MRIALFNVPAAWGLSLLLFYASGDPAFAATALLTRGIVSLTPAETQALKALPQSMPDAAVVVQQIEDDADQAIKREPAPSAEIVTSGEAVKTGKKANSGDAGRQADDTYTLALAFVLSGNKAYSAKAKSYILDWARINQPNGDSIADVKFVPMFRAYDLLRLSFTPSEQKEVGQWIGKMADAVMLDQEEAHAKNLPRGMNNHRSHALLIIAAAGCVTGDAKYIRYITRGFLPHIAKNLATQKGEPDGLGLDYHERKAVHYVAYNLEALTQLAIILDRLRRLQGNPYAINYDPFTVEAGGASVARTFRAFLPYAAGEKRSEHEFEGSENRNDAKRIGNGALSEKFKPADALPALEGAFYFSPVVQAGGRNYDLAQVAAEIMRSPSQEIPTPAFLVNRAISPVLGR